VLFKASINTKQSQMSPRDGMGLKKSSFYFWSHVHFFFKTINDDTTLQCFFVCTVEMEKIVETDLKEVDIFFSSIYTESIGQL
jgi:hypothetical protein